MKDTDPPIFFICPRCRATLRRPRSVASVLFGRGYCDLGNNCIKPRTKK